MPSKNQEASSVMRQSPSSGFTLIEMMIVVAIIGVVAALAAPNYRDWTERYQLRTAAEELQRQLGVAQMTAISRNIPVTVTINYTAATRNLTVTTVNAATGGIISVAPGIDTSRITDFLVGPSPGWTSTTVQNVGFNSMGMRMGGPGPTLNQELALVNSRGMQYALKVTPRGVANWCANSVCS